MFGLSKHLSDPTRRALWGLVVVPLAFKIGLLMINWDRGVEALYSNDSYSYDRPARAWATTGIFLESVDQQQPMTLRTPGYPLFIGLIYRLFGPHPWVVILAQCLLGAVVAFLLFDLANRFWNEKVALLVVALWCLDVVSLTYSLLLLSETLFTVLLIASLWIFSRPHLSGWALLTASFLMGAATLVRPITFYLLILLVPFAVWRARTTGQTWRQSAVCALLVMLPFSLLVGGWMLRNAHQTGTVLLSRIEGINMLYFRAAAIAALHHDTTLEEARTHLGQHRYRELHPKTANWTEERLSQRWKEEGLAWIRQHPVLFLRVSVEGWAQLLFSPGEGHLWRWLGRSTSTGPLGDLLRLSPGQYLNTWPLGKTGPFLVFLFAATYLGAVYVGVGRWLLGSWRELASNPVHLLFWTVGLYLLVLSGGPEAGSRLRLPLMPILCLYAAPGLWLLKQETASWRTLHA